MWGKSLRAVAVLAVLAIAAAACSKPASRGANGTVNGSSNHLPGTPGLATPGATAPGATLPNGQPASGNYTTSGSGTGANGSSPLPTEPGLNSSYALSVGQKIYPVSTSRGPKPYYPGVGDNTIQLDFAYDINACGVNVIDAITAAGGVLPSPTQFYRAAPTNQQQFDSDSNESIALMVRYWNDHAFDTAAYLPHIRPLMGNDPANQFFGRHLTYKIIDGGSNQCPDTTKAAAIQAAEEDHAFAVYNNFSSDGDSSTTAYNMAADLNTVAPNTRPMHFGTLWMSDSIYNQFAPYAWTQFATGTTVVNQLASYICSKLVGGKATRSQSYPGSTRRFGLIHSNQPQDAVMISDFKAALNRSCAGKGGAGIIAKEVSYDGTDFTNAQRDDTNLIVQMHTATPPITSIIQLGDPVQSLFQVDDASAQRYWPEWIFGSYGYEDSSTVQRLWDQTEAKGDFGISSLGVPGGFGFSAGDPFWMYHAYHQTAPDGKPCDPTSEAGMDHGQGTNGAIANYCKAPTLLQTWYYAMLPSVGGLLFAGPDLTPQNVSTGLQRFPETRYGGNGPTDDPRPALVGAGPGKYGFIVDSVEWRWRPEFKSPAPEAKAGWVEYPDCQRHYVLWPNQFSPGWSPADPPFNAWCGAPGTDYPRTLPSDGQH
ncbi:MAG TPA: hypothetical protein VFA11_02860 [Acidimicrobiales bacterium]|nr:hypothetical protein [Acidimicrobiales bacterium]